MGEERKRRAGTLGLVQISGLLWLGALAPTNRARPGASAHVHDDGGLGEDGGTGRRSARLHHGHPLTLTRKWPECSCTTWISPPHCARRSCRRRRCCSCKMPWDSTRGRQLSAHCCRAANQSSTASSRSPSTKTARPT